MGVLNLKGGRAITIAIRTVFKPPNNIPYAGIYRKDGEIVKANDVLVVQRRMNYHPGANPSSAELLRITPKAVEQLKFLAGTGEHLRVSVDSGGCSGFEYKLSLDNKINADDEVLTKDGATVVVDRLSLEFIRGSKLDFTEDLMRSVFRITDNPAASQGCSCGASFAPKSL